MVDLETLHQKRELWDMKYIAKGCLTFVTNRDGSRTQIIHEKECRAFRKRLRPLAAGKASLLSEIVERKEAASLIRILDKWLAGKRPKPDQQERLLRSLRKVKEHFTRQYGELMAKH